MVVIAMKRLSLLSVFVFLTEFVTGQICVEETLDCTDPVSSIFKIGKDSCACDNDKHAGALKFIDGKLMVCLGNRWAEAESELNPKVDTYGTKFNPGESCKDIKNKLSGSPADGVYWIKLPSDDRGLPVYCDMKGGGWTLVFKFISGIPEVDPLGPYYAELPIAEFSEEAISLTNDYKNHYKHRLAIQQYWSDFPKERLKIGLYSSSGQPLLSKPLIFKVNKTTPVRYFFLKENVEESQWTDLIPTKEPAAFHIHTPDCWKKFENCRLFEAMKIYVDPKDYQMRCDGDYGWLIFTAEGNKDCDYEKKPGRQRVILYSKGNVSAKFSDDNAVGVADVMGVFLK